MKNRRMRSPDTDEPRPRGGLRFTVAAVLLSLSCTALTAQTLHERDIIVPVGLEPLADLGDGYFGSQLGAGRDGNRYLVIGGFGNGSGYRFNELQLIGGGGTSWSNTIFAPWNSPRAPVAANGAHAVFGYEAFAGFPPEPVSRLASFGPGPVEDIITATSEAVESLEIRPGLVVAGFPGDGIEDGIVRTFAYNSEFSLWEAFPNLQGFADEDFGLALALNNDGTMLFVGAPRRGASGRVFVYERQGLSWQFLYSINPPAAFDSQSNMLWGASIDVLDDKVIVGAPFANELVTIGTPATSVGLVVLYRLIGANLQQQASFQHSSQLDYMGFSVALGKDPDGSHFAAVGIPGEDQAAPNGGAVEIFRNTEGAAWVRAERFLASDAATDDLLGWKVAAQGTLVAAGSPFRDYFPPGGGLGQQDVGAVYVFESLIFADGFESGDTLAW